MIKSSFFKLLVPITYFFCAVSFPVVWAQQGDSDSSDNNFVPVDVQNILASKNAADMLIECQWFLDNDTPVKGHLMIILDGRTCEEYVNATVQQ